MRVQLRLNTKTVSHHERVWQPLDGVGRAGVGQDDLAGYGGQVVGQDGSFVLQGQLHQVHLRRLVKHPNVPVVTAA